MKVARNKAKTKGKVKLIVDIRFGPSTPNQLASWRRFWGKVTSEATDEVIQACHQKPEGGTGQ